MRAVLHRSILKGEVEAPPSKSYTHRALAVSLLSEGECEVISPLISEDTKATMDAMSALGASLECESEFERELEREIERECEFELEGCRRVVVRGVGREPKTPDDVINARNSGTTLRFFTAICALCEGAAVLTGDDSLRRRTNAPLLKALNDLGADAFSTRGDGRAPIVVRGRLKGGETEIDCSISSQFISALLIACPLAPNESRIKVRNLTSKPYMLMTLDVMKAAGVEVEMRSAADSADSADYDVIFDIEGSCEYSLRRFNVPGDFSSASYMLAAAALTASSSVRVRNLYPSMQGDVRIIEILREMGADVRWHPDEGVVEVRGGGELRGISVNLRENPDLAPTVAVLGAFAEGKTEITGASHLRHKESDRIRTISEELRKFGVNVEERADGFVVHGFSEDSENEKARRRSGHSGGRGERVVVNSHSDHRIAMALCIAALASPHETVVEGVECVSVSYPDFFKHLSQLDADFELKNNGTDVSGYY